MPAATKLRGESPNGAGPRHGPSGEMVGDIYNIYIYNIYIYIFLYVYVCMYMYVYVCIYVCVYLYIYIYNYKHTYVVRIFALAYLKPMAPSFRTPRPPHLGAACPWR